MKIYAGQRWVFTSAHDTMRSEVYIIAYDPATHTASMIGLGDGIVGLVDTTTGNVAATIRVPWDEVKDNNFGLGINAFNQLTSSLSVTHLPNKLC